MDVIEYYLTNIDGLIYISIDMDIIDSSIAPNVGNLTPDGLFIFEIETLSRKNVVGFVVETVSDRLGDNTAIVGVKLIYDFITLIE